MKNVEKRVCLEKRRETNHGGQWLSSWTFGMVKERKESLRDYKQGQTVFNYNVQATLVLRVARQLQSFPSSVHAGISFCPEYNQIVLPRLLSGRC